jgi:KDO2-lipid IV(A) lauroyltransferase
MLLLFRTLARWPLWLLHALGAAAGWAVYALSGTYRQRFREQAAQAGVPWAQARRAIASAGRMVAELPWLWMRPAVHRLDGIVHWEGAEHVQAALAAGHGIVLMTPHLGCFEMCAQAYAERFGPAAPMTALYRPARQAVLREVMEISRRREHLHTAPATLAGVRQMIRALRQGQTIGLLPDQVPPDGLGVWAPFFGRPAYTMTLAARLLQQTGAACLLMLCERLPHGRGYRLVVRPLEEPLPGAEAPAAGPGERADHAAGTAESRAVDSAAVINRAMEQLILQCPHQYLWGYHRYKAPRPLESPAAAAAAGG